MTEPRDITVLIAARNEAVNLPKCLGSIKPVRRVLVIDSHSTDGSDRIARELGADVVPFTWNGRYPRKRQWTLDHLKIDTAWVILLDADESIPEALWAEVDETLSTQAPCTAYLARKEFHFLGRKMRFGGFSHQAVFLFRTGKARFEDLLPDCGENLDMEVHERLIVDGTVGAFAHPLEHRDEKGIDAYRARHVAYAHWEAALRYQCRTTGRYGNDAIRPRWNGNAQERRRFLKLLAMRVPGEHVFWFVYHYILRGGFLEGRAGWLASVIRASYIRRVNREVRAKFQARQN